MSKRPKHKINKQLKSMMVRVDTLTVDPDNERDHSAKNIEAIAGSLDQRILERPAFVTHLGETRGIANCTAGATGAERFDDTDGGFPRNGDEARIRGLGQRVHTGIAFATAELRAPGVHGPDVALEADAFTLANDLGGEPAAEHGDVPGPQKTRQAGACGSLVHYRSWGRNSDREMMWRWISLVPSQMRSTRASRHNRSRGRSSMRPMPPKICTALSVRRASISVA